VPFGNGWNRLVQFDRHPTFDDMLHLDIFVKFWPVQHPPLSMDLEMTALPPGGLRETGVTAIRNRNSSSIIEKHDEVILADSKTHCPDGTNASFNKRSAHAISPGSIPHSLSQSPT
jgi:hypothetical protein